MSFCKIIMSGNITSDDYKSGTYGNDGKQWCSFSIATNLGYGDKKKTVFTQCGAFSKNAENIMKFFRKGDELIITDGEFSQRKHEGKTYTSVVVKEWDFGKMKSREEKSSKPQKKEEPDDPFADEEKSGGKEKDLFDDDPFDDSQIPF